MGCKRVQLKWTRVDIDRGNCHLSSPCCNGALDRSAAGLSAELTTNILPKSYCTNQSAFLIAKFAMYVCTKTIDLQSSK